MSLRTRYEVHYTPYLYKDGHSKDRIWTGYGLDMDLCKIGVKEKQEHLIFIAVNELVVNIFDLLM